jgi:hypothetical protein
MLSALGVLALILVPAPATAAEDYVGKYESEKLQVEIAKDSGEYVGRIHLGQQEFPLKAHENAAGLSGTFASQGDTYDFTASLQGDTLTLLTGGATYTLKRPPHAINPLGRSQPVNPLAGGTSEPAGGAPAGYSVVTSTDYGKAFTTRKEQATSVQSALESTFPDLARYFGARPAVVGAFEDSKDHRSGGASFTAKLNGQPVRGFVSCTVADKGATVAVVYCRTDAPPTEWNKLTTAPPDGNAGAAAPAPEVKLQGYQFPDGTGSVGLAEGWQTNAASCLQGVIIQGPADQTVSIGLCASVVTPDSIAVQTQRQLEANARQWGMRPPPPMQLLVAPYTEPVEALVNLVPQISQFSQRNGGPAVRLDKILHQEKAKPSLPNARSALVTYTVTRTTNGEPKQFRATAQIDTAPLGQGAWMFYAVELLAPQDTFDRDLPVMLAMAKSLQTNDRVVQEKSRQNIDAQNRNFAAMQQAHHEQVEAFDRSNRAWERRQNTQSRSAADFDEVIRGYRTVEDTRTGEHTSVDLGNAHDIVNKLNERDPDRYKEIPLRDEMYPVPPERHR